MPKGSAWIKFLFINLAFILQIFALFYFIKIKEIKDNWPKYRCNPMYMPLSDNISSDFVYCVQSMQSNFMGYLLQPINYILNGLTTISGNMFSSIANIRGMFSFMRFSITNITGNIFSVFSSLVIEFQRIILTLKAVMGKILVMTSILLYALEGSIDTLKSVWTGPPGESIREVGEWASCFLPSTKVRLRNGTIRKMKNLHLGDILENGSEVHAVMKVGNLTNDIYYKIKSKGVEGSDIYVTGLHLIQSETGEFIHVKDSPDAIAMPNKKITWFSCLVTDDHKMQVGEKIFWDWEDQVYYANK